MNIYSKTTAYEPLLFYRSNIDFTSKNKDLSQNSVVVQITTNILCKL